MKMLSAIFFCLGCCLLVPATTFAQAPAATQGSASGTLQVKVKGVGCANDLKTLAETVTALNGVAKCTTLKRGAVTTFEIAYDPALVAATKIHAAIEDTPGCTAPDSRPYKVKL